MSMKTALAAALAVGALALAVAPAGANVQVGSSGWQWGNPLPQGNTVRATAFAGSTGYAAGDFGTLLKTTDGGTTWSGLPVGTLAGLTVVQALDPDTVFAGGGCVARRSVDGGRTFSAIRFTPVETGCRTTLHDLSFVTRDVGYLLLADGSVFATTDGGATFAPRTAVPGTAAVRGGAQPGGIDFLDARTGYATSGTQIFQTLDGGVSWRAVAEAGGGGLLGLRFADATHGFAFGWGGTLLRTDDGGATWQPKPVAPDRASLTSISCNTSRVCILTTQDGTELIRTTDEGDTTGTVVTPSSDPIYAAAFASPTRVAAAGQNGATVISDDDGVTFAPIGGRITGSFTALRAGGAKGTAFAPGAGGALAKTSDGGRTWSTADVPTTASLLDVSFPTANDGYALDRDGGLFHTANGAATWEALGTGSTQRPRALLAPDASTVLVVGPRGIRRSADAGQTFDQVRSRAVLNASLTGVTTARAGGAIFAWGATAVVRSGDGGGSWTALAKPGRTAGERRALRVAQVAFANAKIGLLRDTRGRVWRTTDAGRRWTQLTSLGTQDVYGMTVESASAATLVTDVFDNTLGGYLLHTADAGATWQPQLVTSAQARYDGLVAGAGGVDYLLAGDTGLLFTTTGGVAGTPSALTLTTPRHRLAKPGRIGVTGRLQPASGGARVVVSALAPGATAWSHQTVAVAANGTFTTAWPVHRGTTTFVAQWRGDFTAAGAGSRSLIVTVAPPRARRR